MALVTLTETPQCGKRVCRPVVVVRKLLVLGDVDDGSVGVAYEEPS